MTRIGIYLLAAALLGSAASAQSDRPAPAGERVPTRSAQAVLSRDYAAFRSRQVADVRYRLQLDLNAGEEVYTGRVEIEFQLLHARAPLTVDFDGGEVRSVELAGRAVSYRYNGSFLEIPAEQLVPGPLRLAIAYAHPYASDGSGLARFRDPEDGRVYVHTDFEPYFANRLLPCFDQPDLKASYRLTVDAPSDWQVTSAVRESGIVAAGEGRRWQFPETKRFSTYVFSVIAGPFAVWESRAGDVPLRLMARRSLAEHVDVEEWFRVTQQGMAFFSDYFGIAYPFAKYDQVLAPDYLWGAMENVGNVTFSERFVRRGRYTAEEREAQASTILHEMAHMWFGDLVTMRWWNGLWLNESFADYMAGLALARSTEYRDAWTSFFADSKTGAYTADEGVTTHAIDLPVADTDGALANFDAITYGKGASVLKQLVHLLGEDAFQRAVRSYLFRHAYGNSELSDFIGAMTDASGRDLGQWVQDWLYRSGLNGVALDGRCTDGVIDRVALRQTSVNGAPLRLHRLQIAAFEAGEDGSFRVTATLPAELRGAGSEVSFPGQVACAAFLYPNYEDWAFIKVLLADDSTRWLSQRIVGFGDPLQRAMLWRASWEAVRDARLPVADYLQAVPAQLAGERSRQVLALVLADVQAALAYLQLFGDAFASASEQHSVALETLAWQQVEALNGNPDLQMLWFDHLLAIASTDATLDRLVGLLRGTLAVSGLAPDQDRRWTMVKQLSAHGHPDRRELVAAEAERDPSDNGLKAMIAAAAADPAPASKREWLNRIQRNDDAYSLADLRVAMGWLLPPHQAGLRHALLAEVLAPLASLDAERDATYLEPYVGALVVGYCEGPSEAALAEAVAGNRSASLTTTRGLAVALQEEQRCRAMKRLMTATR